MWSTLHLVRSSHHKFFTLIWIWQPAKLCCADSIRRETSRVHLTLPLSPDSTHTVRVLPPCQCQTRLPGTNRIRDEGLPLLNRAAETEPKATSLHPVILRKRFLLEDLIRTMWDGNTMTVLQLRKVEQICTSHLLCAHFLKTSKTRCCYFCVASTWMLLVRLTFKMKPPRSSRVPLTAFNFLLNGNFATKNRAAFEKRDRLWHHYLTILKYPNFTLQTVKQPYHSSQPSAACCWEACAAARSALIHSSAIIISIFLHQIYWP